MKSITTLNFAIFFMAKMAFGQITLTIADAPQVGDFYLTVTADSLQIANFDAGQAGANRTWNFAYLRRNPRTGFSTSNFAALNNQMPFVDSFRNVATIASVNSATKSAEYYKVGNGRFSYLGSSVSPYVDSTAGLSFSGNCAKAVREYTYMTYPFTFGSTYLDSSLFRQYNYVASLGVITSVLVDSNSRATSRRTADGWGRITTPLGTFDALRVTHTGTSISLFGTFELTAVEWWVKEYPLPILTKSSFYVAAMNQTYTNVTYIAGRTLGTNTFQQLTTNVYPNPAQNGISVDFSLKNTEKLDFVVSNLTGQTVFQQSAVLFNEGNHTYALPLDELSNGTYLLQILNTQKEILSVKKITIAK